MAAIRTNQNILKGSKLMVFIGNTPIAFSTSSNLSIQMNTSEISTKDHGDFPSVIGQNITWEVTTENLYSDGGETALWNAMKTMQPVEVKFAQASNYSNTVAQKGLPLEEDNTQEWAPDSEKIIASGKALVTSLSVNAPAGDNATLSATFTGVGALDQAESE